STFASPLYVLLLSDRKNKPDGTTDCGDKGNWVPGFVGKRFSNEAVAGEGVQLPAGKPANLALSAVTLARPTALQASTMLRPVSPMGASTGELTCGVTPK